MRPDIFEACVASPAVTALLDVSFPRIYQGVAPPHTPVPYVVWQSISGAPENYLADTPDVDSYSVQVDVYANSAAEARTVARALRDALEPHGYITSIREPAPDPVTKNARYSFDIDWIVNR